MKTYSFHSQNKSTSSLTEDVLSEYVFGVASAGAESKLTESTFDRGPARKRLWLAEAE